MHGIAIQRFVGMDSYFWLKCSYFEGELDSIQLKQKENKKSPETKEPAITVPSTEIKAGWEKELPSFLVEAISTESSGSGITVGTCLSLEPECKVRLSRKKAQIVTKNVNESLPARCRLYLQTGPKENQRVIFYFWLRV